MGVRPHRWPAELTNQGWDSTLQGTDFGMGNTQVEIVTTIGPRHPPELLAYTLFTFPMCDKSLSLYR
jgi:hypothetical protein